MPARPPRPVHPRACGEQDAGNTGNTTVYGSSPRMRGTAFQSILRRFGARFIPAHAGNRRFHPRRDRRRSVHPRACGEQRLAILPRATRYGSSPRMRGTEGHLHHGHLHHRFIPAHAGNSSAARMRRSISPVHPRACGEQASSSAVISCGSGSSPRMRGTEIDHKLSAGSERFIPAHAGNRGGYNPGRRHVAVHPRACGEQMAPIWWMTT